MGAMVHLVMWGWIPIVLHLFSTRKSQDAVLITFLCAWLFLPNAEYHFSGLPEYNKISATCIGILGGAWLFDRKRFSVIPLSYLDMPILIWCLAPFFSSLTNGLGFYDGFSCSLNQTVAWGLPYLVGKLYFSDIKSLNKLVAAMVIGGLLYVPLCLIEIRFSPQLHNWVYGFHQHDFGQTMRHGGYRPMVFMEHGLMLGMWMISAAFAATWSIISGSCPTWLKHKSSLCLMTLLVTMILVKSTGALILYILGLIILIFLLWFRTKLPLYLLIILTLIYVGARSQGVWSGESLVYWAEKTINHERAQSLAFRLENEELIVRRARLRPWFGWADWGRWRVFNDEGEDITISDSLWVIVIGRNGIVGLSAMLAVFLMPCFRLFWSKSSQELTGRDWGGAAVLSVLLVLYAIDCLFNAMINPFFALCAGAVSDIADSARIENISKNTTVML